MGIVDTWLANHHLVLAPEKTEAVILKGPTRRTEVGFIYRNTNIKPVKAIRYLGVMIDSQGTFGAHIMAVVKKADERSAALGKILPNVGGPSSSKRILLMGVVHSILLYGAPVWKNVIRIKRYKEMLERAQRKVLLRVARAYRTVSTAALQVIAGVVPIDLLVEERSILYEMERGSTPEVKSAVRARTMNKWQQIWAENTEKGQWTKQLIPDVISWTKCPHRRTNYFLTQFLTGHGSFRTYIKRIGKSPDEGCVYCGETDTLEHTILVCERWNEIKRTMWPNLGHHMTTTGIINEMVEDSRKWSKFANGIERIMELKEKEERELLNPNP